MAPCFERQLTQDCHWVEQTDVKQYKQCKKDTEVSHLLRNEFQFFYQIMCCSSLSVADASGWPHMAALSFLVSFRNIFFFLTLFCLISTVFYPMVSVLSTDKQVYQLLVFCLLLLFYPWPLPLTWWFMSLPTASFIYPQCQFVLQANKLTGSTGSVACFPIEPSKAKNIFWGNQYFGQWWLRLRL